MMQLVLDTYSIQTKPSWDDLLYVLNAVTTSFDSTTPLGVQQLHVGSYTLPRKQESFEEFATRQNKHGLKGLMGPLFAKNVYFSKSSSERDVEGFMMAQFAGRNRLFRDSYSLDLELLARGREYQDVAHKAYDTILNAVLQREITHSAHAEYDAIETKF